MHFSRTYDMFLCNVLPQCLYYIYRCFLSIIIISPVSHSMFTYPQNFRWPWTKSSLESWYAIAGSDNFRQEMLRKRFVTPKAKELSTTQLFPDGTNDSIPVTLVSKINHVPAGHQRWTTKICEQPWIGVSSWSLIPLDCAQSPTSNGFYAQEASPGSTLFDRSASQASCWSLPSIVRKSIGWSVSEAYCDFAWKMDVLRRSQPAEAVGSASRFFRKVGDDLRLVELWGCPSLWTGFEWPCCERWTLLPTTAPCLWQVEGRVADPRSSQMRFVPARQR